MLRLLSTLQHTNICMSPKGKGQPSQTASQMYFEECHQNFLQRSKMKGSRIFIDDSICLSLLLFTRQLMKHQQLLELLQDQERGWLVPGFGTFHAPDIHSFR